MNIRQKGNKQKVRAKDGSVPTDPENTDSELITKAAFAKRQRDRQKVRAKDGSVPTDPENTDSELITKGAFAKRQQDKQKVRAKDGSVPTDPENTDSELITKNAFFGRKSSSQKVRAKDGSVPTDPENTDSELITKNVFYKRKRKVSNDSIKQKRQRKNKPDQRNVSVSSRTTITDEKSSNQEVIQSSTKQINTKNKKIKAHLNDSYDADTDNTKQKRQRRKQTNQNNTITSSPQLNSTNAVDQDLSAGLPVISNINSQFNANLKIIIPYDVYQEFIIKKLHNSNDTGQNQDPVFNSPQIVKLSNNSASLFSQQPTTVSIESDKTLEKYYFNNGDEVGSDIKIVHKNDKHFIKTKNKDIEVFDWETYFFEYYYDKGYR